jgi:hypothetical protein
MAQGLMLARHLPGQSVACPAPRSNTAAIFSEPVDARARIAGAIPAYPTLAPLIQREIFYCLLQGEQGAHLRQITSVGNHGDQIAKAIDWLKANFSKPVKVEELAGKAGLSVSAFHNHFRSTTAMSPLQFQRKCAWMKRAD